MKSNLIFLISVIFILLVGMAMTGCVTPLRDAIRRHDINTVKDLLNKGEDKDYALLVAAAMGSTDIVKLLIEKGADVNVKDSSVPTLIE